MSILIIQSSDNDSLYDLKVFIENNSNVLGRELTNELDSIFKNIDADLIDIEEDRYDLFTTVEEKESNLSNIMEEVEGLFENAITYGEDIEEVEKKAKLLVKQYSFDSFDEDIFFCRNIPNSYEIKTKMKKMGYRFGDTNIPMYTRNSKAEKENPIPKLDSSINFAVEKIDEDNFRVYSYGMKVDAIYSKANQKVTGKGSRKYNEEIKKRAVHCLKYEEVVNVEVSETTEEETKVSKEEATQQETPTNNSHNKTLLNTFTTNQYKIELFSSPDHHNHKAALLGEVCYKYHLIFTDITTGQINEELSDTVYLSLDAAKKEINLHVIEFKYDQEVRNEVNII